MKRRSIFLGVGLAVTVWLTLFGDKGSQDDISQPVVRGQRGAGASATSVQAPRSGANTTAATPAKTTRSDASRASASAVAILALQDRADLLGQGTPIPASPRGKKGAPPDMVKPEPLFDSQTWNPPPPPPPKPTPPPPPVAPPLPYLVLGKKFEDQSWEVYLARGDQTFIAREKGTIENQYRVDSISPPTMTLTYLPLNQVQTLTIGGTD